MRPPFYAVIDAAILRAREEGIYEEGDETLLGLAATAFMHMAADAGRPSDAARTTCARYLRNPSTFRATP
jgi:hypothetical protein